MTREEAIENITEIKKCEAGVYAEALEMAIKALEQESKMVHRETLEQVMWERDVAIDQLKELGYEFGEKIRTDKDAISRQAVIDLLYGEVKETYTISNGRITYRITDINVDDLMNIPSVTPQQKVGRWIKRGQDIYCSICNNESVYNPFGASKFSKYCPNCGAKMQKETETCKDCTNKCIMYDPNMKGCKDKMEGAEE